MNHIRETVTMTRREITHAYMPLCLGMDRMLGTDTYSLLYDGRYPELIEELDKAKDKLEFNLESVKNMQEYIGRLK